LANKLTSITRAVTTPNCSDVWLTGGLKFCPSAASTFRIFHQVGLPEDEETFDLFFPLELAIKI